MYRVVPYTVLSFNRQAQQAFPFESSRHNDLHLILDACLPMCGKSV